MSTAIPFGRLSKRRLLLFVASIIATVFSYLFILTTPVMAADGDAKWEQGSIVYNDKTYRGPKEPNQRAGYDLPAGTIMYISQDPGKLSVMYFKAGSDTSKATNAKLVTYNMDNGGRLTDKSDPQTVTIDVETSDQAAQATNPDSSSCKVDGIGWIVCPVTNFLATGMDWVFDILSRFVEVQPLSTDINLPMHRVWDIMRGFANVAFVISFLIIIYSQLTSVGLSNYGIKKLLPRIIIAAILVNVSYWICTIAIDISNILGYSLQGVFLGLRDTVMADGGGSGWQATSWESVAGFVLAGGAAGGAALTGVILAGSTMGAINVVGVTLLLLPILLGAFLTVLVVLFIFAARQAIITILIIISPLALVAYLLPNTEKWFEKWRGLFMTMLIFFPTFSLVFGGAQFAGLMIITAAADQGDINMLLLGMAVQIAPLAITPLLLKLSGSLLSKIGGMINDPSRGIKDRTKNWAKDRQSAQKAGQDVKTRDRAANGTLGRRHFVRRTALGMDNRRRLREGQKANNETRATSMFDSTDAGYALNRAQHRTSQMKEIVDGELKTKIQGEINLEGSTLHADRIELDTKTAKLKTAEGATEQTMAEYKTEHFLKSVDLDKTPLSAATLINIKDMQRFEEDTAIRGLAAQGAKRVGNEEAAMRMKDDSDLRARAGGIDPQGAQRALASAFSTVGSSQEESIKNADTVISYGNYSPDDIVELGKKLPGNTGLRKEDVTEDLQIAAIRRTAGGKNADALSRLATEMPHIRGLSKDVRQEFGNNLKTNSSKPLYISAGAAGAITEGNNDNLGTDRTDDWVIAAMQDGKYSSAAALATEDKRYIKDALESLNRNSDINESASSGSLSRLTRGMGDEQRTAYIDKYKRELSSIVKQMHSMHHDSRFSGSIGNRDENLGKLYETLTKKAGANAMYESYEDAKVHKPPEEDDKKQP